MLLVALGPEYGRQVEEAARRTPETRRHWLAVVTAWLLPQWGFCPGGATGPSVQRKGGEAACGPQLVGHRVLACVLVCTLRSQRG